VPEAAAREENFGLTIVGEMTHFGEGAATVVSVTYSTENLTSNDTEVLSPTPILCDGAGASIGDRWRVPAHTSDVWSEASYDEAPAAGAFEGTGLGDTAAPTIAFSSPTASLWDEEKPEFCERYEKFVRECQARNR
jgi:hypothetical protein